MPGKFSFDDTMLMSHCINGGSQRHNLDSVVKSLLDHETIKLKDLIGSGKKELNFKNVPISLAAKYAAEDADMTFRVWKILKKELVKQSVYSVYQNIDKPMVPVLVDAELKGVEVDRPQLQQLSDFFEKKLRNLFLGKMKFSRLFNISVCFLLISNLFLLQNSLKEFCRLGDIIVFFPNLCSF